MKLHKRTLLKGIIWESGGLLALFILTWIWTGQKDSASGVSLVYTATRTIGFYFYTRLWKKIEYGREPYKAPK